MGHDAQFRVAQQQYRSRLIRSVHRSSLRVEQVRKGKSLLAVVEESNKDWQARPSAQGLEGSGPRRRAVVEAAADDSDDDINYLRKNQAPPETEAAEEETSGSMRQLRIQSFNKNPAKHLPAVAQLQLKAHENLGRDVLRRMRSSPNVQTQNEIIDFREHQERDLETILEASIARVQAEFPNRRPNTVSSEASHRSRPTEANDVSGSRKLHDSDPWRHQALYLTKVEPWHRDLVWSQKFDCLDQHAKELIDAAGDIVLDDQTKLESAAGSPRPRAGQAQVSKPTRAPKPRKRFYKPPRLGARPAWQDQQSRSLSSIPTLCNRAPTVSELLSNTWCSASSGVLRTSVSR
mmetsp:Transcript_34587/g.83451  ORF Transcript_34587/g.83451 Transcript_34587/m.83451 type:complete len:348 (-) Transcript_34587:158-1201(-)